MQITRALLLLSVLAISSVSAAPTGLLRTLFTAVKIQQRGLCYAIVSPDPAKTLPHVYKDKPGFVGYEIKFGDGSKDRVKKYQTHNPNFAFAYNDGPDRAGKAVEDATLKKMKGETTEGYVVVPVTHEGQKKMGEWYRIMVKEAEKEKLEKAMEQVLQVFPTLDLTEAGQAASVEKLSKLLQMEDVDIETGTAPADAPSDLDSTTTG